MVLTTTIERPISLLLGKTYEVNTDQPPVVLIMWLVGVNEPVALSESTDDRWFILVGVNHFERKKSYHCV